MERWGRWSISRLLRERRGVGAGGGGGGVMEELGPLVEPGGGEGGDVTVEGL